MKTCYHLEITRKALAPHFSEEALKDLLTANIRQDRIRYQFGHDYIHFDGSAFTAGFAYIQKQESLAIEKIAQRQFAGAREALGRITHAWQDYYSHSNYVRLWHEDHKDSQPEEIDPADPDYLNHPALMSGKNYGLPAFFAMIPGLAKLVVPLMPADSHAKTNLDSPASGPLFALNYQAALKRTALVYQHLMTLCNAQGFTEAHIAQFQGKLIW